MAEKESYVKDHEGRTIYKDISNDETGKTERWKTWYPGDKTPQILTEITDHKSGTTQKCAGTDIFGNPVLVND